MTPIEYVRNLVSSKLTDYALTVALLIVAFALIYVALFAHSKLLKAGALTWALLP